MNLYYRKCHDDQAIYDILELNTTFHVDNTMEKRLADIDLIPEVVHIVEDATRKIRETRFLTDSERDTLLELAASPAIRDFQIDPIRNQVSDELRSSFTVLVTRYFHVAERWKCFERVVGWNYKRHLRCWTDHWNWDRGGCSLRCSIWLRYHLCFSITCLKAVSSKFAGISSI